MVPRWLVLACLLAFASTVLAAAPVVDFNIIPSPAVVNQEITFDPGIFSDKNIRFVRWQFDSDGNQNYDLNTPGTANVLFSDNFNDGDLTGWTQANGTWSAAPFYLQWMSGDPASIYVTVPHSITLGDMNLKISYKVLVSGSQNGFFSYMGSNTIFEQTGYTVRVNSGSGSLLRDNVNILSLGAVTPDVFHDINIWHSSSGQITVFVDGVNKGTAVDTFYNTGTHFIFGSNNDNHGASFDDLNVLRLFGANSTWDINETHTFTTSGTKTITLTVGNADGNTSVSHTVSVQNNLKVHFYDENTGRPYAPGHVTVNGVPVVLDSNITISIPVTSTPADYVITAWDENKAERSFGFYQISDVNMVDINAFLLDRNKGQLIQFQIFHPDKLHTLGNAIVALKRKGADANYSGLLKTDSVGRVDFFVNQDANYTLNIDANANGDSDFNYVAVILTVKIPKDESLLTNITPYHLLVSGLASYDLNNLTTDKTIPIFSNTVDFYKINVSSSSSLVYTTSRNYVVRTRGNPLVATLQPYLVSDALGAFSSTITLVDIYNRFPQANILVKSSTTTGDGVVLVESSLSDSAGRLLLSFILNKDYTLEFDNNGTDENLIGSILLNASSSTYVIGLNIQSVDVNQSPTSYVDINYMQTALHNPNFDVNWCLHSVLPMSAIRWTVYDNQGTTIGSRLIFPIGNPTTYCDGNTFLYTRPVGFGTLVTSQVVVTINNVDFNLIKVYSIYSGNEIPLTQTALDIKENITLLGTTILALLVGLGIHRLAAPYATGSTNGLFLLFGAVIGIFAYFQWVSFTDFAFGAFFSLFAWIYANGR